MAAVQEKRNLFLVCRDEALSLELITNCQASTYNYTNMDIYDFYEPLYTPMLMLQCIIMNKSQHA